VIQLGEKNCTRDAFGPSIEALGGLSRNFGDAWREYGRESETAG
jgi:hypothetical protein